MTVSVLSTIRELLKFKDYTTISEIAKYSELKVSEVLSILNSNSKMVQRDRSNGRITAVRPREVLKNELYNSGRYYMKSHYGTYAKEGDCYVICGKPFVEIPESLYKSTGYTRQYLPFSEVTRESLESLGFLPWGGLGINDRLWVE